MKSKKILNILIFAIGVFFLFTTSILAEKKENQVGVDYNDSQNSIKVERNIGTGSSSITSHIKKEQSGEILYCADHDKGNPSPEDKGVVYWNCDSEVENNKEQLLYILNNGFKNSELTSDFTSNTGKQDRYFVKQMAIWKFTRPGWTFDGFNASYNSLTSEIDKMINAANNYKNRKPAVTITAAGNKTMSLTKDGKYYISNQITLEAVDLSNNNITVTVSGASGAFVTNDASATGGNTTFTSGSKVYVKVPANSINTSTTLTLSASGSYIEYTGKVYDCTPENKDDGIQNVIHYVPSQDKKTVSNSINLSINLKKVLISKQDITGTKEIEGAILVIKKDNTPIKSWKSTTTAYTTYLSPGTYTLEETIAPKGYIKSTSKITFIVKEDGKITVDGKEVTAVVMKNEPITVYISKKSINGKTELPGAKLKITDKDGKIVKDLDGKDLEWTSSTKEESFHLAAGTYYLTEITAPEGYELSETTIEFTVTEDGKVKINKKDVSDNLIVFTNTPEPTPVKTGSFIVYIIIIGTISVGLVTYYIMKKQII